MSVLIKKIRNINSEGVSIELTESSALKGGLKSRHWRVSWDKIGAALFDDYSTTDDLSLLRKERGEVEL
jgi:hypothetical protein